MTDTPPVIIPLDQLHPETLQRVIEEFVTRDGTDYGKSDIPLETKIRQVRRQLETGAALLLYDMETQTCTIFSAEAPAIKQQMRKT